MSCWASRCSGFSVSRRVDVVQNLGRSHVLLPEFVLTLGQHRQIDNLGAGERPVTVDLLLRLRHAGPTWPDPEQSTGHDHPVTISIRDVLTVLLPGPALTDHLQRALAGRSGEAGAILRCGPESRTVWSLASAGVARRSRDGPIAGRVAMGGGGHRWRWTIPRHRGGPAAWTRAPATPAAVRTTATALRRDGSPRRPPPCGPSDRPLGDELAPVGGGGRPPHAMEERLPPTRPDDLRTSGRIHPDGHRGRNRRPDPPTDVAEWVSPRSAGRAPSGQPRQFGPRPAARRRVPRCSGADRLSSDRPAPPPVSRRCWNWCRAPLHRRTGRCGVLLQDRPAAAAEVAAGAGGCS